MALCLTTKFWWICTCQCNLVENLWIYLLCNESWVDHRFFILISTKYYFIFILDLWSTLKVKSQPWKVLCYMLVSNLIARKLGLKNKSYRSLRRKHLLSHSNAKNIFKCKRFKWHTWGTLNHCEGSFFEKQSLNFQTSKGEEGENCLSLRWEHRSWRTVPCSESMDFTFQINHF